jgi:hypothetical protein
MEPNTRKAKTKVKKCVMNSISEFVRREYIVRPALRKLWLRSVGIYTIYSQASITTHKDKVL